MPLLTKKKSIYIPSFILNIRATHQDTIDLIEKQFTARRFDRKLIQNDPEKCTINFYYYKVPFAEIPRSQNDCFKSFAIFHNEFWESDQIFLDVGPRMLKTIVDPETWSITSYIATPPNFDQDLLFDLIFFQPIKHLLQMHGGFLFHSSCVVQNNKAVLFWGESGCGKTTLALSLARSRFEYLSDDEVILSNDHTYVDCRPFPLKPKIRKESLALFPEFKRRQATGGLKKQKVLINGFFLKRTQWIVKPAVLILPRFSRTAKTRLEPVTRQSALSCVMGQDGEFIKSVPHIWRHYFTVITQLIRQCQVYRLHFKDQDLRQIPGMIKSVMRK